MKQRAECFSDWYKMAQTVFLQTQILTKDVDNYERTLELFSDRLSLESRVAHENLTRSLERLPGQLATLDKPNAPSQENAKIWKSICKEKEIIALTAYENGLLIDQINEMCMLDSSGEDETEDSEHD